LQAGGARAACRQTVEKIAKLVELKGVDRSTVLRELIDIGLDSPQVLLLLRRLGTKGRTQVERVIRVVAANERVKVTQAAVMRAPSVEAEVNALRAEEDIGTAAQEGSAHSKTVTGTEDATCRAAAIALAWTPFSVHRVSRSRSRPS
jgi:hypothetical protein